MLQCVTRLVPALALIALSACASLPPPVAINGPTAAPEQGVILPEDLGLEGQSVMLAFSGGGARAAAFSYGVLRGLGTLPAAGGGTLLERVSIVTAVSGGAISAAWFGLHGPAGLDGFRAAALDPDWQAELHTSIWSPSNLINAADGGMNAASDLAAWLDTKIFRGARMSDLRRPGHPAVILNATDMANAAPFVFGPQAFSALCSELGTVRVADAVAASMAVPLAFRPVVVEAFPGACTVPMPRWAVEAETNRKTPQLLRTIARAYRSYRDPALMRFVHLFDGGVIDNFGLSGLTAARLAAETPFAPLSARDAVRLTRLTVLLVDAGQANDYAWARTIKGPNGAEIGDAAVNAAMDAAKRAAWDAFTVALRDWQGDLRAWRCALPAAEVRRLRGSLQGWRCDDLNLAADMIWFGDLPPADHAELAAVPTQVSLPRATIDHLIAGGERAVRANPSVQALLAKAALTN
jgi:predicted acylesterase/phospholipase RssA